MHNASLHGDGSAALTTAVPQEVMMRRRHPAAAALPNQPTRTRPANALQSAVEGQHVVLRFAEWWMDHPGQQLSNGRWIEPTMRVVGQWMQHLQQCIAAPPRDLCAAIFARPQPRVVGIK